MANSSAAFDLSAVLKLNASQLTAGLNAAAAQFTSFASKGANVIGALATKMQGLVVSFDKIAQAAQRSGQVVANGLNNAAKAATGLATAAGAAGIAMTKLASDANEAASKFGFVFGAAADKTGKSLDEFSKAAGRSRYEMRSMAADIGALIKPMGFTEQKTGELSTAVAKLAVDLSSFFNVSESDALIALRAGIVGESEPLRRLGVTLNEAKIQTEAFALGLAKTKTEVQGAVKAQAILSLVFKETQQAQGDAIRTGDQLANSWRRMTSFIKDAATDLGQVFIPAATKYVRAVGDMATKAAEWANANREFLTQKLDVVMSKVEAAVVNLGKAFSFMYDNAGPVIDVLKGLYDNAVQIYETFMAWFSTLPEGTQNALKVAAAMTAIGVGLEKIGGSIPIVGQFATSFGQLLNPLNAVQGAFAALLPMIGAGGSIAVALAALAAVGGPITLLIAALAGASGLTAALSADKESLSGLADTLKGVFSEAFAAAKEAAKAFTEYMNGDVDSAIGHIHKAVSALASAVGAEGLAKDLKALGDSEIMKSKGDQAQHARNVEQYGETGAGILKARSAAQANADKERDKLHEMTQARNRFFTKGSYLATLLPSWMGGTPSDEEYAAQKRRVAEATAKERSATGAAMEFERSPAERFKAREIDYENKLKANPGAAAAKDAAEEKNADAAARKAIQEAARKKRVAEGGEAFDANTPGVGGDFWKMVAEDQEKAKIEYDQQHASEVAQSKTDVTRAQAAASTNGSSEEVDFYGRPIKTPDWMKANGKKGSPSANPLVSGLGATPFMNLLQNKDNTQAALGFQGQEAKTALLGVRGTVTGALSPEEQKGMAALSQFGQQIMNQIKKVADLDGEEKTKAIQTVDQMQKEFFGMTAAVQNGKMKLSDLAGALQKTAKATNDLAEAEEEKALNAQGKLSPRQQQAQAQQQQMAQQMAQGIQQAMGMANEQNKAIWQGVFGGAEGVQQMIDQAVATGNTNAANQLIRGRIEAQLQQSKQNLHILGTSTIKGDFNADNSAYEMTKDTPFTRLIKFLESQLNKMPKMAAGGIVTSPTQAIVGEAGPEAVLPLTSFRNMLGSLPVFQGIQNSMEKIGTWFSQGGTVGFGNMMGGNNAGLAARYFANLAKIQHTFDYSMDRLYNSRSVNFTPASMMGGPMAGGGAAGAIGMGGRMAYGAGSLPFGVGGYAGNMMGIGAVHLNFHGVDISAPGAAVAFAQKLFPALDAEARRAGYSMMGGSALRSGRASTNNRAYGYAR